MPSLALRAEGWFSRNDVDSDAVQAQNSEGSGLFLSPWAQIAHRSVEGYALWMRVLAAPL
jgi:hypothetical protein